MILPEAVTKFLTAARSSSFRMPSRSARAICGSISVTPEKSGALFWLINSFSAVIFFIRPLAASAPGGLIRSTMSRPGVVEQRRRSSYCIRGHSRISSTRGEICSFIGIVSITGRLHCQSIQSS